MITLSLVSHTNAGKTTLARTLLGKDVGEVRDAAHVTTEASAHRLIETPEGDALVLWDTPGFGDSARLAKRLALEGNPIGWFLTQIWDRFRDRAFFLTQRAVRNVRPDPATFAGVLSEDGHSMAYVFAELAQPGRLLSRFFFPVGGAVLEDPATGSAAAAFAGAIMHFDAPTDGISQFWIEQGLEMGRPSRIRLELNVDGGNLASARIGGHAIKVAEGKLTL